MQTNGAGQEPEPITSINITPLVDVSLVLVIIFMMTMPFLVERALRINSLGGKAIKVKSDAAPILVEILSDRLKVDGRLISLQQLAPDLRLLLQQRQMSAVMVSAQRSIPHGLVVEVLDQVNKSGAAQINLLQPEDSHNGSARHS